MEKTASSHKRQRRTDIMEEILHLGNMPDSVLTHVTSYLSKESSILFAAGVTTPSSSSSSDNNFHVTAGHLSSTILSSLQQSSSEPWTKLDVGDLEKYKVLPYSTNLTDDDLYSVLVAIDAINCLKSLQLTGCTKITGRGLAPLRGSTIIESIDLGLARCGEEPKHVGWGKEPEISEKDLLPILDSIVAAEENALKFIMLPKKWRNAKTSELTQFLGRYNQLLVSREPECEKCYVELNSAESRNMVVNDHDSEYFGIQSYCCNMCMKNYCYECEKEFKEEGQYEWQTITWSQQLLTNCETCEKDYCGDCVPMDYCGKCKKQKCSNCAPVKGCDGCGEGVCKTCDEGRWCYHTTADYRCGPCNQGE